jgi:hypothetical protein
MNKNFRCHCETFFAEAIPHYCEDIASSGRTPSSQ